MFDMNLQLFGGRGGSGGSGFGGKSDWIKNGTVINMDDYMDVIRTILNDDEYYYLHDTFKTIDTLWNLINDAVEDGKDQLSLKGILTTDMDRLLNGMSINMQGHINYSNTLGLQTLTLTGLRGGEKASKYKKRIADYFQNVSARSLDYNKAKIDSEAIKASPSAVNSLARKGEKTIMHEPDSYKKYLAMSKKIERDSNKSTQTLSDNFYIKHGQLYEKYGTDYRYGSAYRKRYG